MKTKNKPSRAPQSILLALAVVFITVFSISFVSAWTSDTFVRDDLKIEKLRTNTNYGSYIFEETSWYDPLGIWTKEKVKEVTLKNNSDFCREDCYAIKEIQNLKEGSLIDDVRFYRIYEDGSEKLSNIRSYQFKYWGRVDDYETICVDGKEIINLNGTSYIPKECNQVKISSHEDWINYELGKEMPIGNYTVKLIGQKRPSWSYDWQVETNGEWLESWAVWGGTGFVGSEYQLMIVADNVTGATGDIVITQISTTIWKINTTNADDEVSRALVMKWLFYGTDGTNPRATSTYITNPTAVYTNDARDNDKRGIYAYGTATSTQGTYTGTFLNTATNTNVSSWSKVGVSYLDGGTFSRYEMPSGSILNEYDSAGEGSAGEFDEIGTNKVSDQRNNPATLQFEMDEDYGGKSVWTYAIILSNGGISWINSGLTTYGNTDFYINESFPIMTYTEAQVTLNSPTDNYISPTSVAQFNCSAEVTVGATLTNMSLWTNESGTWEAKNTIEVVGGGEGLISYYGLDEQDTTGTGTIVDSIGTNNGINNGTSNTTGKINTTYDFATYDNHIALSETGALNPLAGNFAINIWINTSHDRPTFDSYIYGDYGVGNNLLGVKLNALEEAEILLRDSAGQTLEITDTGNSLRDGSWHMVTVVRNSTTSAELYVDGSFVGNDLSLSFDSLNTSSGQVPVIGRLSPVGGEGYIGKIDEVGLWNRSLNSTEISNLYNSGAGARPTVGTSSTQTWSRAITSPTLWTCQACDSDGDCGFATENRTVSLDNSPPTFSVESPTGTLNYNYIGNNETLNVTFTDSNLDSCWYNYNGTNITIDGCLTGVKNSTTFVLEENNYNMTIYANDLASNENSTFIEWNYTYLEHNRTHNVESYETASESFNINVEGPTSVSLFYNGTEYTTTKSGNNFNRTIQIPVGQLGNNSIYWRFNDAVNSYTSYQNVSETVFTLCNTTYTTTFLNVSFKDEADSSVINATIPTSTFAYWLGDGTVTKSYTLINNTANYNYEFCATPNRILNTDIYTQYKQGSAYPQRIYDAEAVSLSNVTTNLTLYLLGVADGLYVTFQVFGGQANALQGVDVTGTRIISGSTTTVAQGTTDAAGTVTFWINPDFSHIFTFIKTGYETVIETLTPTQTLYTITMGGEAAAEVTDDAEGVVITTLPQGSFLDTNTFYTFTYIIDSSVLDLSEYGFELFYNNGTSIYSNTGSVSTGGTLDKSFNTTNESRILMTYYYITNETRINGTTYWLVYQTNDFSIYHFFTRISTYIDYDLYGIQGDDEGYFAKAMISILILILVTGTLSMRYGLASDAAVTGLLFGVIFMLNMFSLIPTPDFIVFINLGDFLVFIVALYGIVTIIKEEGR